MASGFELFSRWLGFAYIKIGRPFLLDTDIQSLPRGLGGQVMSLNLPPSARVYKESDISRDKNKEYTPSMGCS
jgi:hypothetical protein